MHQILFTIPAFHLGSHFFAPFAVYTYGVMLSIAFAVGLMVAVRRAKAAGLPENKIADLCIVLLVSGVVGSRLLYVFESWGDYAHNPLGVFNLREGGLSLHGGLIVGFLAGLWFVRTRHIDFWKGADALAPAIAIGMGIGRIGCFFNGCCLGIPTTLPWGVVFKDNTQFFGPRHPTQLYEMTLNFLIAAILMTGFKKAKPGAAFLWLCILSGTERFFMEFLRAEAIPAGPLSVAQWFCLAIVVAAGLALARRHHAAAIATQNT